MRIFCVLVAVLGLAVAYPTKDDLSSVKTMLQTLDDDDSGGMSQFEELLLSFLEGFRDTMKTGSDSIPVLDPFELESLSVDDSIIPLPGARVALENVEVNGLATFEVNSLRFLIISVSQQLFALSIDLEIPVIEADAGKYDLSITALGFTIYGAGELNIRVIRPRVTAYLEINLSLADGIALTPRSLDATVTLGGFEAKITGLFNDPASSDFVGNFLGNLVPELFEVFETEINEFVSDFVFEIVKDLLEDFDIGGILG